MARKPPRIAEDSPKFNPRSMGNRSGGRTDRIPQQSPQRSRMSMKYAANARTARRRSSR